MDRFGELDTFLEVVETGRFSAAARRLGRSPSTVSKLIGRLEARLQVRLFDRIGASIRLTQEGSALADSGVQTPRVRQRAFQRRGQPVGRGLDRYARCGRQRIGGGRLARPILSHRLSAAPRRLLGQFGGNASGRPEVPGCFDMVPICHHPGKRPA